MCEANGKEVIVRNKKTKIDLVEDKYELKCPLCLSIVKLNSFIYANTIYREKIETKCIFGFDNGYQNASDSECLQYFNKELNGVAQFSKLIIEIVQYY